MQNQPPQPQPTSAFPSSTTYLSFSSFQDPKTILYIISTISFLSLLLILSLNQSPSQSLKSRPDPALFPASETHRIIFNGDKSLDPAPPSIAYLISGSKGDSGRILRLLFATYHPRNHYLLHLGLSASQEERDNLALYVQSIPIFKAAQNVNVIGKADFAYSKGSSPISLTLHGASILLRLSLNWDWFISLSPGDYPLVTQDDLLHILSFLPKSLNFMNHSSYIGWKESRKLKPVIVDPGLYLLEGTQMFYASQKRDLPNAFHLFTGSSFSILSREFIEFCILGTDNLPRILLMYLSNTPSSISNYFSTILCNSRQFNRTVINNNLLYAAFEKPSKDEPRPLTSEDFDSIMNSGAAFGRNFQSNDPVLDRIDWEVLTRSPGEVVPGGWCLGDPGNGTCSLWGDAAILRPTPGARRLEKKLVQLLSDGSFISHQCVIE